MQSVECSKVRREKLERKETTVWRIEFFVGHAAFDVLSSSPAYALGKQDVAASRLAGGTPALPGRPGPQVLLDVVGERMLNTREVPSGRLRAL